MTRTVVSRQTPPKKVFVNLMLARVLVLRRMRHGAGSFGAPIPKRDNVYNSDAAMSNVPGTASRLYSQFGTNDIGIL